MHRHPLQRTLAAVLAVWFAVVTGEWVSLHRCPMHDGPLPTAAGAQSGGPISGVPTSTGADAGHPHHGGPAQSSHHGGTTHTCTCLGHCSAAGAVTVPARPALAWLAGVIDIEPRRAAAPAHLPAAVDYLRPFANGPPRPRAA